MEILLALAGIVLSGYIIWRSTGGFEQASDYLGRRLTKGIKGATINAVASSMPEFLSTLFFLFYLQKSDGFSGALGVTAGSAIFNILIIPIVIFIVVKINNKKSSINLYRETMLRDGPALILMTILLAILLYSGNLTWLSGLLLTAPYLVYVAWLFVSHKKIVGKGDNFSYTPQGEMITAKDLLLINLEKLIIRSNVINSLNAWVLLSVSTFVMMIGTWLLVYSTDKLGAILDIPIIFISVMLAAAASSIPDTMISARDARKGNYEDAFSNALGSNIFDISFALGFPLFLYTVIYGSITLDKAILSASFDIWMALLVITIISVIIFLSGRVFNTFRAALLTVLYGGFLVFIYFEILLNNDFINEDSIGIFLESFQNIWNKIRELLLGMW
jgi:Ca2+/Na+ antiporter